MLRTIDSLKGYSIRAIDDELGKVEEVYFDDERWGVRYLIVRPGSWLTRQRVLISLIQSLASMIKAKRCRLI